MVRYEDEPVLAFYTPDRILDVAYCYYLVSTNGYADRSGSSTFTLAQSVVGGFEETCQHYQATIGTPEWKFLTALKPAIVSLARGIERRRHELDQLEKRTLQEREYRTRNMTLSKRRVGFLKAAFRSVILGGFGYFLARTFVPWIEVEKPLQPTYASLATGLGAILVGSIISSSFMDKRVKAIFHAQDTMTLCAQEAYRRGAQEEYLRAKKDTARIWAAYVGREPQEWPGYETILQEEQELADMIKGHRANLSTHPLITLAQKGIMFLKERLSKKVA